MSKYISIPTEIEAIQWFPEIKVNGVYIENDSKRELETYEPNNIAKTVKYFVVTINKQRVYLEPGDWIVTEPDGMHYYPIKDEIFKKRWKECK